MCASRRPSKEPLQVSSTAPGILEGHSWPSLEAAMCVRNVRSSRYWIDYVMRRRVSIKPQTDHLPAARGRGERKSLR